MEKEKSEEACSSSNGAKQSFTTTSAWKRLHKEIACLIKEPPECISIDKEVLQERDMSTLIVEMRGPRGTLYDGENFRLQFKFDSKYPFNSPEVIFVGDSIPVHPHVYSNGHICLSILTEDWTPALSIRSVCLSVISVLASASEKKPPPDNTVYVRSCNKNPKKTQWWYHDDNV